MGVEMICFIDGDSRFNFRVSGVFVDSAGKKFLTNTRKGLDYCVLPGGRVEMGEDSATSLAREIEEELGVSVTIQGIKCIAENFYDFEGKKSHELQYVYVAKLNDDKLENKNGKFLGVEEKDIFEWHNLDEIDTLNYVPAILKPIISEVGRGDYDIRHIIHRGNG